MADIFKKFDADGKRVELDATDDADVITKHMTACSHAVLQIDGIKNDFLPLSNFSYGAELTEMALLGVLAQRYGAKIKYDSKNMRITNNNLLNSLLKEEMREGWSFNDF